MYRRNRRGLPAGACFDRTLQVIRLSGCTWVYSGNRQGQRLFRTHINKPRRSGGGHYIAACYSGPVWNIGGRNMLEGRPYAPVGACWGRALPPSPSAPWPGAASPSTTQTAMPGVSTVHARRTLFSKPGYSKRNPRPADNPSGTPVPTGCRRELQGCTCSTIEIPYHRPHACRRTTR